MKEKSRKSMVVSKIFLLANRIQATGDQIGIHITFKQHQFLETLSSFPAETAPVTHLAASLGTSRQNVKKMAELLERDGYVEIKKDEKDARILNITMTGKITRQNRDAGEQEKRFNNALFSGFEPKEIKIALKFLERIERNMNKISQNPAAFVERVDDESETLR